jgi:hypothetical protein
VDVAANAAEVAEEGRLSAERTPVAATQPAPVREQPPEPLAPVLEEGALDMPAREAPRLRAVETQNRAAGWKELPPARGRTQAQPAQAQKAEPAGDGERGPTTNQVRRFKTKWNAAKEPEQVREALKYGLDIGHLAPEHLQGILGAERRATPEPEGTKPTQPGPMAASVGTQQQAAQGAPPSPAQPAPPDLIMGQPRKAVQNAAEQVHFVVTQLRRLGLTQGWGTEKPEVISLFEEFGVAYECKGDPHKRLVELTSVELAEFQGGGDGSSTSRRAEIALMTVALVGPGLIGPIQRVAVAVGSRLVSVARVVGGAIRRGRR